MATATAHSPNKLAGLGEVLDIHRIVAIVRRRLPLALAVGAGVFAAVVLVTLLQPQRYTATANVLLDQRPSNVMKIDQVVSDLPKGSNVVDTEVEVIRSRALADRVVTDLRLDQDPEFNPALRPKGLLAKLRGGSAAQPAAVAALLARQATIDNVQRGLKVGRTGLTYMINVSYEASNPKKAATIANRFAEAYIAEQLKSKYEAIRQANAWLSSRLGQLRIDVQSTEAAVEQYRIQNNLLSAEGATLTEQQISRLDEQLALARAEQAERNARLSTALGQLAKGSSGDDVGEALGSQVVQNLRKQRAEVAGKVAEMSQQYGDKYPPLLQQRSQLAEIDTQISEEIHRIISNLEAQAEVARQRAGSIHGSVVSSKDTLAGNNRASVHLRELERNADAVRKLYETFLGRYRETSSQVGLADSDARIVSPAKPPINPSAPNIVMGFMLGALLGGGAGLASITLAEALDTSLSTTAQVEEKLGVNAFGSLPLLSSLDDAKGGPSSPEAFVLEKPQSSFAESIRNLLTVVLASADGTPVKVIAVTSALPGEGKSTTSIGLGRVCASTGQKVVLVDCDVRHHSVTNMLRSKSLVGLAEVLDGSATLDQALIKDPSGADVLPLSSAKFSNAQLGGASFVALLETLRGRYDVVILDTPPVLPIADALAIGPLADTVLFLLRWRKTPQKAVEAGLRLLDQVGAPVGGLALTFVDMRQQARQGYGDAGYYYQSYKKYYLDS